jgi:tubulin--tyrosine ligase
LDFLVDDRFNVSLLEVNAGPDFGQTGSELEEVIVDLFEQTIKTAIIPFFCEAEENQEEVVTNLDKLNLQSKGLKEVLRMEVSKGW